MTNYVHQREIALDLLADEIHRNAVDKGWHDEPRSFGADIALAHSELSEALEAYRDTGDVTLTWYRELDGKPEGVASELADVIIRVLDTARAYDIDVVPMIQTKMAFNATRPHRHGNKHL